MTCTAGGVDKKHAGSSLAKHESDIRKKSRSPEAGKSKACYQEKMGARKPEVGIGNRG